MFCKESVEAGDVGAVLVLTRLTTLLIQLAFPGMPPSFLLRLFRRDLGCGVSIRCGDG